MFSTFKINKKRLLSVFGLIVGLYFSANLIRIYNFSFQYSETKSDVAIVLGASTKNNEVSPIFKERINHSIYLYESKIVTKIIFTGGYGKGQNISDSELAKKYALKKGIPSKDILIEKKSRFTIENLIQAKIIMDSCNLVSALIVSDPLHMKRSIALAKNQHIECKSSPTKTTMYKSFGPKTKSLFYEALFFSLGQLTGKN
tara:strand:+ start:2650 stop:3252 length:603 start_codon:yes stop_codon:yes gene_type:complete